MKLTREQVENILLHYTGMEGDQRADGLDISHVRALCHLALSALSAQGALPEEPSEVSDLRRKDLGSAQSIVAEYIDALRAHAAGMARDAARYRWLRDVAPISVRVAIMDDATDSLDAAIAERSGG